MISVSANTLAKTFEIFTKCGHGRRECVAFWIGPVDEGRVEEAIHPKHVSSASGYRVDDEWINQLWFELGATGRRIHAQIHTHPGSAFHSESDDEGAVAVHTGFISIVVPSFCRRQSLVGARAFVVTPAGWQQVSIDTVLRPHA